MQWQVCRRTVSIFCMVLPSQLSSLEGTMHHLHFLSRLIEISPIVMRNICCGSFCCPFLVLPLSKWVLVLVYSKRSVSSLQRWLLLSLVI